MLVIISAANDLRDINADQEVFNGLNDLLPAGQKLPEAGGAASDDDWTRLRTRLSQYFKGGLWVG
jgi:hypothetical protein